MRPRSIAIVTALALATAAARARSQESMTAATVLSMKEATTYIRISNGPEGGDSTSSGSGFVIGSEGMTAYVVTNAHVIAPPKDAHEDEDEAEARPTIRVYFRSGTKAEGSATAEVVAESPGRDLAILKVTNVANLPRPVAFDQGAEPFETMTVYIFGFPFGERLTMGKGNPPVNVGRGQVSSIRRGEDDRLRAVLLDGALNPGNSGGPVVDARGRLVGISRATIRGANIGFAVAVPQLLDMLDGAAGDATISLDSPGGRKARVAVEVPLIDPLGKVRSARLLYTLGPAKFTRSRPPDPPEEPADLDDEDAPPRLRPRPRARREDSATFVFGPLEGAQAVPLAVHGQRASGTFELPAMSDDLGLWCQVSVVDGSGKSSHSRPTRCLFGATRPTEHAGEPGVPIVWGEVVDPDGDSGLETRDGELVCNVPGTLHDLNIDVGKNNAPRVLRAVEGDFVASVKVAGSFRPGPVRTGPKSVPYNGGGLVVWLDEGNYVRLERGAMYRNNRVMGLLAFESREGGTRAQAHNKGGLDPDRDLWLRLERRGKVLAGSLSSDGRDWEDLQPMEVDWPVRLRVGLDAINSCGDPMTVRFRHYSLETPGGRAPRPAR